MKQPVIIAHFLIIALSTSYALAQESYFEKYYWSAGGYTGFGSNYLVDGFNIEIGTYQNDEEKSIIFFNASLYKAEYNINIKENNIRPSYQALNFALGYAHNIYTSKRGYHMVYIKGGAAFEYLFSNKETKRIKTKIPNTKTDYAIFIGAEYKYFLNKEWAIKVGTHPMINFTGIRTPINNLFYIGISQNI